MIHDLREGLRRHCGSPRRAFSYGSSRLLVYQLAVESVGGERAEQSRAQSAIFRVGDFSCVG
eukprot:1885836-Prymnesium_polylepis.1